jgi:cyclic pyranopterin phosphate synthase
LSCYYCHNEGQSRITEYLLTPEDITFIVQQSTGLGFNKIKLTGGEPLLRKDIVSIISKINEFGVSDFSMITNGVLLYKYAYELRQAGLPRLNVSFQTLNKKVFWKNISKNVWNIDLIIKGIDRAISIGYTDLKLNFIYHSEVSKKDFEDICQFASERNLIVVLLPILLNKPRKYDKKLSADDICNYLLPDKVEKTCDFTDNDGINKRMIYLFNGARILIRLNELPDINPFKECEYCKKKFECREGIFSIRILSNGCLLPCLEEGLKRVDLKDIIINRKDIEFRRAINSIAGKSLGE